MEIFLKRMDNLLVEILLYIYNLMIKLHLKEN